MSDFKNFVVEKKMVVWVFVRKKNLKMGWRCEIALNNFVIEIDQLSILFYEIVELKN
jgi:hypothetical protein